jgi:hypothetical protein
MLDLVARRVEEDSGASRGRDRESDEELTIADGADPTTVTPTSGGGLRLIREHAVQSCADAHETLRGRLGSAYAVRYQPPHQFVALPGHVRILWFLAAFEALTILIRALRS